MHNAESVRLSEPTTKISILSRAKMHTPTTLVSGDIKYYRRFKRQTTVRLSTTAIFSVLLAIFRENLDIRPALLYNDTQSVVSFSLSDPKMHDLEWHWILFRVKFCFRSGLSGFPSCDFRIQLRENLRKIDQYCQRHKSSAGTLVSGYEVCANICAGSLEKRRQINSGVARQRLSGTFFSAFANNIA